MSTAQRRGSSWTNPDGLVVGFGTQRPVIEGGVTKNYGGAGGAKVAAVKFDYKDLNANDITVPVPAGTRVIDVRVVVGTAWTDTGSNGVFEVGDGSAAAGFITTTNGAVANMTAGAVITVDGVYTYDNTADGDTTAAELKLYAAADTIDLSSATTDWLTGDATLVVTYL